MKKRGVRRIGNGAACRRARISELATDVAEYYSPGRGPTDLQHIVETIGVGFSIDDYGGFFDGMLIFNQVDRYFSIHIDEGRNSSPLRERFTLAHELGHLFVDEHRWALMSGVAPHYSVHTANASHSAVEQEADLFAGCLLAPESRLRQDYLSVREFAPRVIHDLARKYDCSYPAMESRFAYLSLHPLMRLTVHDGELLSSFRSAGFTRRLRHPRIIPEESYLHDLLQGESGYDRVHEGYVADWFELRYGEDDGAPLFEYYRRWGDRIYGLLWEP